MLWRLFSTNLNDIATIAVYLTFTFVFRSQWTRISIMAKFFHRSFGPMISIKLSVQTNLYRPCWQGFLEIAVKYPKIDLRPPWKTISSLGHLPPPGKNFWMVSQFILRQHIPRRPKFALSSGRIQHYLKSGYIFELSWSNTAKLLFYLTDEL